MSSIAASLSRRLHAWSKARSRRNLYRWLEQAVAEHRLREGGAILNIGAGGVIAERLREAGVAARSVDVDAARAPDLVADVEDLAMLADASIDAVVMMEVLEHVRRPDRAVGELRRVLKPGGIVIGSTPFLLGIHDQPYDYYRYTLHGLNWLFREFTALTVRERNGYFAAVAVLVLRCYATGATRQRRLALLLAPLLVPLALVLECLDALLPSLAATTGYFFIYRKPAGDGA